MYLSGRWILRFWGNSMCTYPFCTSFATEVRDLSFCSGFRGMQTLTFLQIDFFKEAGENGHHNCMDAFFNYSRIYNIKFLEPVLSFHSSLVQPWCFHQSLGNLIKYSEMTFPIFPILRCMCFPILMSLN